jgi:hypothetical protein
MGLKVSWQQAPPFNVIPMLAMQNYYFRKGLLEGHGLSDRR